MRFDQRAASGIVTSVGPLAPATPPAFAIGVVGKGSHAVSEDAKRNARMIAAYVSEQLATRDYLPAGKKAGKAKRQVRVLQKGTPVAQAQIGSD
jgi:hypothetical protein